MAIPSPIPEIISLISFKWGDGGGGMGGCVDLLFEKKVKTYPALHNRCHIHGFQRPPVITNSDLTESKTKKNNRLSVWEIKITCPFGTLMWNPVMTVGVQ